MTATLPDSSAAPATRAPGVDTARAARRVRGVVLWVLAVVLGGALIAYAAGRPSPDDYLHPDGTGQTGTRALVEVLREQGVDVEVVDTAQEALDAGGGRPGTTVVVGNSALLGTSAARLLLDGAKDADGVVLLDGAPQLLFGLGLGLDALPATADPGSGPDCTPRWVRPADRLTRVSWSIVPVDAEGAPQQSLPSGATGCYPLAPPGADAEDGEPSGYAAVLLPATAQRPPVTVVGFPDAATNRFVTEADDAGLLVRLLGASPRLVWYHPTVADLAENPSSDNEPVTPTALGPGIVVLGLAFLVFALSRGRRLGRLVPERLPVVVRATETTESRAELYRAAADRARAATVLRRASTGRLAARLGVPPGAPLDAVVRAVSAATGHPAMQVEALLRDAPPVDEAALVSLAQQLTVLEQKVTTP